MLLGKNYHEQHKSTNDAKFDFITQNLISEEKPLFNPKPKKCIDGDARVDIVDHRKCGRLFSYGTRMTIFPKNVTGISQENNLDNLVSVVQQQFTRKLDFCCDNAWTIFCLESCSLLCKPYKASVSREFRCKADFELLSITCRKAKPMLSL